MTVHVNGDGDYTSTRPSGRTIGHTHIDGTSTSVIDHFVLSRRLLQLVEDCGPVHCGDTAVTISPGTPQSSSAREEEPVGYTTALHQPLKAVQCPGPTVH